MQWAYLSLIQNDHFQGQESENFGFTSHMDLPFKMTVWTHLTQRLSLFSHIFQTLFMMYTLFTRVRSAMPNSPFSLKKPHPSFLFRPFFLRRNVSLTVIFLLHSPPPPLKRSIYLFSRQPLLPFLLLSLRNNLLNNFRHFLRPLWPPQLAAGAR